jgi:histone-lysine N-methyltransferase SETMAR
VGAVLHSRVKVIQHEMASQGIPPPKKFETQLSAAKITASVFWDSEAIHVHFLPYGAAIHIQYYSNMICNVHQEIQKKRPRKPSKKITLLYDNACPHTENLILKLATMGWEIMNHPPYSPEIMPVILICFDQ